MSAESPASQLIEQTVAITTQMTFTSGKIILASQRDKCIKLVGNFVFHQRVSSASIMLRNNAFRDWIRVRIAPP
ncbi:uncharacterized protein IAS62_005656 [Cryptococcus decagattii]|uniref:Uncharacterized protein n=1 Tax=Cryptococcus decagattii TaxID=1859122 RepID=A0ABZ2B0H0_9TREE